MSAEPQFVAGSPPAVPPPPAACLYTATVATTVVTSSLSVEQPLSSDLRSALVADPGWVPWPPPQVASGSNLSSFSDSQLVLLRLKALFDFAAGIEGDSSAVLSEQIDAEWPSFSTVAASVAAGQATATYEQSTVSANVYTDASTGWRFERNVNDGTELPIPEMSPGGIRPEYDRVVQNLVRLDLLRRIEGEFA